VPILNIMGGIRLVVRLIQQPKLVEETDENDLLARPANSVGIDASDDPLA
jgi:hypothetical protein